MEYENKDRKTNPTKIIIFIIIGGFLVILADLFIFGGAKNIMNNHSSNISNIASIEVAMLKEQHNLYMNEGINIDPSMLSKSAPSSKSLQNINVEEEKFASVNVITIDEIIANKKAEELSNINPALGLKKDIKKGFSHKNNIEGNNIEEQPSQFVDIISKFSSKSYEDVNIIDSSKSDITAYEYIKPQGSGKIAIIIDDMGVSLRSKLVEILPAPLTLSYLPYAKNLKERTKRASQNGHELMVHIPMQPINTKLDTGPKVLSSDLSYKEFAKVLDWALSSFSGFVGVNNHMGSKVTQNKTSMVHLMKYLKEKQHNIFFIDSKTIGTSIAATEARKAGVPYAERDIFIDHKINKEFIENALRKLEVIAHKKGYAIAIGHPHKETIVALKKWLPTLKDKGLTLVPASELIKQPKPANDNLVAER